jgi:tetratricopeptide (TPR) repeat protein
MKAKERLRFEVKALRELAGDKVFARGADYYRDGQVVILSIRADRVVARVAGTEDYRTELSGRGANIEGQCSCPAFADWGFCKHMVATALAANAAGPEAEAAGSGALARIRDHLRRKGVAELVDMIVDLAERDPALFHKLELAAVAFDSDDATLESRLRKHIDDATRTRSYIEYREAADWAAQVDTVLDTIEQLASGGHAGVAFKLAERAIDRIAKAIASVDDSDGHCGGLLERARDIHLEAAERARPDAVALARNLFARQMGDDYDTFHDAVALYADVLGEPGLDEYRRLASEAWDKLALRRPGRGRDDVSDDYRRLMPILDFFAERAGDLETRIALRAKDLSSAWRYLQLAEFCRENGREQEALRRAEEGLWMFEDDRPDERLLFFTVDLLAKVGRKDDAEAHLWRAFEKQPTYELYQHLRKIGGKAGSERVIELLKAQLGKKSRSPWLYPADLLVRILTHEKMYDAAWATARQHQASSGAKQELAKASEATHPREALEVYAARVEELINIGGYAEAVELVSRMAPLRNAAEQASYISALKVRHGRKRNLMKLL